MLVRRAPSKPTRAAALAMALSCPACAALIDADEWDLAAATSTAQGTGGAGASGGAASMGGSSGSGGTAGAGTGGAGGAGGQGGVGGGGGDGAGRPGWAVSVAPPDDFIDLKPTTLAAPASGFTWELWFKGKALPTDTSNGRAQILLGAMDTAPCEDIHLGFGTATTPQRELAFKLDGDGDCAPAAVDDTPLHHAPPMGFQNDTWYHVAAVVDYAADSRKLYVNAVLVDQSFSSALALPQTLHFNAGRFYDGGTSESHFDGAIDDIRVYAAPLGEPEIAQHYNGGAGAPGSESEPSLQLGWRFDEGMGTLASPFSDLGLPATLENGATWVTGIVPTL